MAKYGHFKNSKASMNNYEPLYRSKFDIILTPPPGISANWDLVMEGLTAVGGLDEVEKFPALVEQKFKGSTRKFAGGSIDDTTINITLDFEVNLNDNNSAYVYKALRQWCDLIYDPNTGRYGLKKDYLGGPMIISAFNQNGDIYRQFKFPNVFPGDALPGQDGFDFSENDIFKIEGFTLVAEYAGDIIL